MIQEPVTCPRCGREAVQLHIAKLGIDPIACDWCAEEWERAESESAAQTRAGAFAASGIPNWAAVLEPDDDALDVFLQDMGSRGVRVLWIERETPDAATRDACRILRAWMARKNDMGHYRSGAFVSETEVYSKDGIGAAASAGLLVIDGFGRRSPTRYEAGRLRELVEKRRVGRMPLVIATKLDIGKAGDVIGRTCDEGIAVMDSIVSMMRGQR